MVLLVKKYVLFYHKIKKRNPSISNILDFFTKVISTLILYLFFSPRRILLHLFIKSSDIEKSIIIWIMLLIPLFKRGLNVIFFSIFFRSRIKWFILTEDIITINMHKTGNYYSLPTFS